VSSSEMTLFNDPHEVPLPPVSRRVGKELERAHVRNAVEVYKYGLAAAARSQMDQYDSHAAEDAADAAAKSELRLLKTGLAEAGGSAAAAEIVSGWVVELNQGNHRRFRRRFGA
jgi:hypothetical protein